MLYVISGAAASGKKTIAKAVATWLPRLEAHHDNERLAATGNERVANLEGWIEDALRLEADGIDLVLAAQSPVGEILASPRAIELEGIAPLLLDCHDFVRWERILARGIHPDWPPNIDTLCWAVFHRMHARDPQWEQRVLLGFDSPRSAWSRWTGWRRGDPRWDVLIHDTSEEDVETSIEAVAEWIRAVRRDGSPLARPKEWWKA